jgi:hypothetical protein
MSMINSDCETKITAVLNTSSSTEAGLYAGVRTAQFQVTGLVSGLMFVAFPLLLLYFVYDSMKKTGWIR